MSRRSLSRRSIGSASLLAALVLGGAASPMATATATQGERIAFEQCEEVFAFVNVPAENAREHVPAWFEVDEVGGGVDVHLRTARCLTTIDGVTADGLSSEVRVPIRPPGGVHEDGLHLVGYQLSWATDDQAYASWVKEGTGLDGIVTFSKALARTSSPDELGRDASFSFDSPAPPDWAFRFDADATWPRDEAKTPVVVDIYRQTSQGLVRFRAESRLPGGDRIGGADIEVTVPADTALARLLDGAEKCVADEEASVTRCHAGALVHGYAVEIEGQSFTKTVIPDHAPPSLEEARRALRKYADVSRALDAGYVPGSACEEDPDQGAQGIHFFNVALIDDVLDPTNPELLLYLPTTEGLRLVAVEYLVDEAVVDQHPMLFDRRFDGPMDAHPPIEGIPVALGEEHYDLHVWLFEWAPNPAGTFAQYNPALRCVPDVTEGALS